MICCKGAIFLITSDSLKGGEKSAGKGTDCCYTALIMKLINISNRLPVTVGKTIRKSSGGLVTAMENLDLDLELKWIGWAGSFVYLKKKQEELSDRLDSEYGYIPVFLTRKDIVEYYQGFSNSSLWPVFHYMPNLMRYEESWWDSYVRINRQFCEEALKHIERDSVVWVHDYHLLLLPEMLKEARPDVKVGFFLHTPFPSYEVFRCHPKREQLVRGLLGADLVGFHTFGYVRHLKSAVLRLLGYESDMKAIHHEQGMTYASVFPIGINASKFLEELDSKPFKQKKKRLEEIYKDKKIVLSVERLDYTKGIRRRLDAIDTFLQGYKDKNSIVFIFVSVPSREEVREYRIFIEEIESLVGKINGTHATVENIPIHFIHRSINFHELCALYNLADVALVTPLFDGMNLVAKEYIACQNEGKGMLILSEFAGAADELFSAEIVNPYNINQLASVLQRALNMDVEEKQKRMEYMRNHVIEYDATYWAGSFLKKLQEIAGFVELKISGGNVSDETVKALIGGQRSGEITKAGAVAVLPISGVISPKINMCTDISVGTSLERLTQRFRSLVDDPSVGAIILDIDSPGGSVEGLNEFADEVFNARGSKKIVAISNYLAASGAYWIGTAADEFVAAKTAKVGSIGVFIEHRDLSKMAENLGVAVTHISAGKFKTEGNEFEPLTEEATAHLQELVDAYYEMFVGTVARNRGVKANDVKSGFGEGRVLLAEMALKENMIDGIETMDELIARLSMPDEQTARARSQARDRQLKLAKY